MKKHKLYWIRHAESLSNVNYKNFFIHPILTQKGLIQCLNLGEYFVNNINHIDHVYSSMSLRTILTSLISVSYYNLVNDNKKIKEIFVVPHICEKIPYFDKLYFFSNTNNLNKHIINNLNKQNNIIDKNTLEKILEISVNYINNNIISLILKEKILSFLTDNIGNNINNDYQDLVKKIKKNENENMIKTMLINLIEKYNCKNKMDILKLINIKIDTKLINFCYETDKKYNLYNKNDIYNLIGNYSNNKTILLFSHKYYLNKIVDNSILLKNCEIIKQYVVYKDKKNIYKTKNKHIKLEHNLIYNISTIKKIELANIQSKINGIINLTII